MLSQGGPARPRWAQLTYTVCDAAGVGQTSGWQVKQASKELGPDEVGVIVATITPFTVPTRPSRFPAPAEIAALPRRLDYLPGTDGSALFLHTVYAGPDASRRPDNTFTHALLDRAHAGEADRGARAREIELWGASEWLTPYGAEDVNAAVFDESSPPGRAAVAGRRSVVTAVLDEQRVPTLGLIVDAVAAAAAGGPRVVLIADSTDLGATWIGAVATFAPAPFAARVGFSTYQRTADLVSTANFALSVVLREDLPDGKLAPLGEAGLVVVDVDAPRDPSVLTRPDRRRVWEDDLGREVPETAWSDMVLAVGELGIDSAIEALDRMDSFVAQAPARAATYPAVPLAQVVLEHDRLAIDKELLARARRTIDAVTAPAASPAPVSQPPTSRPMAAPAAIGMDAPSALTSTPVPAPAPSPAAAGVLLGRGRTAAEPGDTERRRETADDPTRAPFDQAEPSEPSDVSPAARLVPRREPMFRASPRRSAGDAWHEVQLVEQAALRPRRDAAWVSYLESAMLDRAWLTGAEPAPVLTDARVGSTAAPGLGELVAQVLWACQTTDASSARSAEERRALNVWRLRLLDFLVRAGLFPSAGAGAEAIGRAVATSAVLDLYAEDAKSMLGDVGPLNRSTADLFLAPAVGLLTPPAPTAESVLDDNVMTVRAWLQPPAKTEVGGGQADTRDIHPAPAPAPAPEPRGSGAGAREARVAADHSGHLRTNQASPHQIGASGHLEAIKRELADPQKLRAEELPNVRVRHAVESVIPLAQLSAADVVELVRAFGERTDLDFWPVGFSIISQHPTGEGNVELATALLAGYLERGGRIAGPPEHQQSLVQLHGFSTAGLLDPGQAVERILYDATVAWPQYPAQRDWITSRLALLCIGAALVAGRDRRLAVQDHVLSFNEVRGDLLTAAIQRIPDLRATWEPFFHADSERLRWLALGCSYAITAFDSFDWADEPVRALLRQYEASISPAPARDAASVVLVALGPLPEQTAFWRDEVTRGQRAPVRVSFLRDWWAAIDRRIAEQDVSAHVPQDERTSKPWS